MVPGAAMRMIGRTLADAWGDVVHMSPRRVGALAWLAVKESIRRWVLVVFGVFLVILLFAGFFLDPASAYPGAALPELRADGHHVPHPAAGLVPEHLEPSGRYSQPDASHRGDQAGSFQRDCLGADSRFHRGGNRAAGVYGTAELLLRHSGAESYARGLCPRVAATAGVRQSQLSGEKPAPPIEIETEMAHGHRHTLQVDAIRRDEGRTELIRRGRVRTDKARGHWHEFSYTVPDNPSPGAEQPPMRYTVSGPEDRFVARVPVYGKLQFKDSKGDPVAAGVNVGSEWAYRSFIQGGTLATAMWTFDGVTPRRFPKDRFPEGIPLELTIEVFRTYKGDTEGKDIPPIHGSLMLHNPTTDEQVEVRIFPAKEFSTDTQYIPWKITCASDGRTFDLFEDFVQDGKLEVWIRCIEPAQYFGMAQADVYLRARDGWFAWNFVKGYLGIWMQMLLLIAFGVMFSTFLSGPVAILATLGALIGGMASRFMMRLAAGELPGGGPVEAFYRLLTQDNLVSDLPEGVRSELMVMSDTALKGYLGAMTQLLPAFEKFDYSTWVAYGFNISGDLLAARILTLLGFVLPVFLAGYFLLKLREVAR